MLHILGRRRGEEAKLRRARQYESKWIWEPKWVFRMSERLSLHPCFFGGRMTAKILKAKQCERSGWAFCSFARFHHVVASTYPNGYYKSLQCSSATRLQFPWLNQE